MANITAENIASEVAKKKAKIEQNLKAREDKVNAQRESNRQLAEMLIGQFKDNKIAPSFWGKKWKLSGYYRGYHLSYYGDNIFYITTKGAILNENGKEVVDINEQRLQEIYEALVKFATILIADESVRRKRS